jgi:hypothetical protein
MNYPKNNNPLPFGPNNSQVAYGGIDNPNIGQGEPGKRDFGWGHGHENPLTGYNRPPVGGPNTDNVTTENALGWNAIVNGNRPNIDIGGGNR